jgi:hypothetical protein
MFGILDYSFSRKDKKRLSGSFAEDEPVEKINRHRCLRRFDFHYVKCPYCSCSELYKSITFYFSILRSR